MISIYIAISNIYIYTYICVSILTMVDRPIHNIVQLGGALPCGVPWGPQLHQLKNSNGGA